MQQPCEALATVLELADRMCAIVSSPFPVIAPIAAPVAINPEKSVAVPPARTVAATVEKAVAVPAEKTVAVVPEKTVALTTERTVALLPEKTVATDCPAEEETSSEPAEKKAKLCENMEKDTAAG